MSFHKLYGFEYCWNTLTPKEKLVYTTMAEFGLGCLAAAEKLQVSKRTTEYHMLNVYSKFGFKHGATQAIAAYYKNKLEKLFLLQNEEV
jgi:DNA-binding NarL/FixJ family response regulator